MGNGVSCRGILGIVAFSLVSKLCLYASTFASQTTWDTSTRLLLAEEAQQSGCVFLTELVARLLIWDNVYFITIAQHGGPEYENELAFSSAWASVVRYVSPYSTLTSLTLTAAGLSLVAHVTSCVVLYLLTDIKQLRGVRPSVASALYSLCPAGIFLISGCAESPFALLSFVGLLVFVKYRKYLLSSIFFALATQLRSNGLFWGGIFAVSLWGDILRPKWRTAAIASKIVGGAVIGLSFVWPQYLSYELYCPGLTWCNNPIPSVYAYVQSHYWNNGFLRYWTLANLPNFLLGAPTLILLVQSSKFLYERHLVGLAAVQMIIVVGALLFWHVQIITRIASCFPGPYWYLASMFDGSPASRKRASLWAVYFVLWTFTQAALYGAFLPPA